MRAIGAWKKLSGILAVSVERDFERKVLPVLRIIWPSLEQVPARGKWDSRGVDLIVWSDSGPFPCIVQCKGFHEQEMGSSQIRQVEESIESFRKSDIRCDTYLLIHNRDGRYREFNDRVVKQLEQLVSEGKARRAELWDRQKTLDRAFNRMKEILSDALHEHSRNLLTYFQSLFEFGRYYSPVVPIIEKRLVFK